MFTVSTIKLLKKMIWIRNPITDPYPEKLGILYRSGSRSVTLTFSIFASRRYVMDMEYVIVVNVTVIQLKRRNCSQVS